MNIHVKHQGIVVPTQTHTQTHIHRHRHRQDAKKSPRGKKSVVRVAQVESITSKPFTRNQRASSLSERNKSALTDHASHDNHVISWPASTILDRESDRSTRWIKEAVHIRKEGRQSLNRDEVSYTLSHTYDRFLATSHHYRGKNRKRN